MNKTNKAIKYIANKCTEKEQLAILIRVSYWISQGKSPDESLIKACEISKDGKLE